MVKKGRVFKLNKYNKFNVSYGTVDITENKSIYIDISAWLQPKLAIDVNKTTNLINKFIKKTIYDNMCSCFDESIFIVDLNLRESGIRLNKKSYMNINITLYNKESVTDIEQLELLIDTIIDFFSTKFSQTFLFRKKKNI